MSLPQEKVYTIDDIYNLPDGERMELINRRIYAMAPHFEIHQRLSGEILGEIITVYYFTGDDFSPHTYTFTDKVRSNLFPELVIDFNEINEY